MCSDGVRRTGEGESSESRRFLEAYVDRLSECGVVVEWMELRPLTPGTWVKTVGYHFIRPNHVVVPGLIGQVANDVFSVCTPGILTLARLEGLKGPDCYDYGYGYRASLFEELPGEPSSEERSAARELASRAFEVYEEENGWTGYLAISRGRPRSEFEARRELHQLARWLDDHWGDARHAEIKGRWKRTRKILIAFGERAGVLEARRLADRMNAVPESTDDPHELLEAIRAFAYHPVPIPDSRAGGTD